MKTILLLEDDRNLNRGISLKLQKEGYHVLAAYNTKEAKAFWDNNMVELIISDIMLEEGSGLEFCESIRRTSDVYIIFLTAMDSEIDTVHAYDIGADDYIIKPFSLMVLVSKVHAFMRRVEGREKSKISSGNIEVSYREMKAYQRSESGQELLPLSRTELQLLVYLMENGRQIVSKEQILSHIWDAEGQFVDENTVPVNISRLKSKIGNGFIQNVRGMGYIWTMESTRE